MSFSKATQDLLAQLNESYPGSVILRMSGEESGTILPDQVDTQMLGTRLMIEVTDQTAPDFVATREMLKMLLMLNGYPQVYYQLATENGALDEQRVIMINYLSQAALHAIIYREQATHKQLTPEIISAYAAGVKATLTPEANDPEQKEAALRLLTLIDAGIFMYAAGDNADLVSEYYQVNYPKAWQATQLILEQLVLDQIKTPATVGQAVQTLFKAFDAQMLDWNLPELGASEFATLTPSLTPQQLKAPVFETFGIRHVNYKMRSDDDDEAAVFVGELKSSGQNSFVLKAPGTNTAEFFKSIYALPAQDLFTKLQQPFTFDE